MSGIGFGPQTANYATARPAADPIVSSVNTWFKDSSSAGAKDGTVVDASWLNMIVAQLRTAVVNSGLTIDDTDDAQLFKTMKAAAILAVGSGGGGTALPTNALGYLKNDGLGNLSWAGVGSVVAPQALLADQRSAGSVGDALATGVWTIRTLNTDLLGSTGVVALTSNLFTPVKNSFVRFKTPVYAVGRYRSRLYCVTDGAVVMYSDSGYTGNTGSVDTQTSVGASAQITAGKQYRLDSWVQTGGSNAGGLNNLDGGPALFSTVEIFVN